jgi:hypothetical protein
VENGGKRGMGETPVNGKESSFCTCQWNEWTNKRMKRRKKERMNEQMNERMKNE